MARPGCDRGGPTPRASATTLPAHHGRHCRFRTKRRFRVAGAGAPTADRCRRHDSTAEAGSPAHRDLNSEARGLLRRESSAPRSAGAPSVISVSATRTRVVTVIGCRQTRARLGVYREVQLYRRLDSFYLHSFIIDEVFHEASASHGDCRACPLPRSPTHQSRDEANGATVRPMMPRPPTTSRAIPWRDRRPRRVYTARRAAVSPWVAQPRLAARAPRITDVHTASPSQQAVGVAWGDNGHGPGPI
ncbi:MAG: hypothetical protein QOF01_674 [Thermomicrobiales bacterium]|jgi:hypothetical protein|nr:hypothetical protein [Thermomicrobiales bacterium]